MNESDRGAAAVLIVLLVGVLIILADAIIKKSNIEKRDIVITSPIEFTDGYYQENSGTAYFKGIEKTTDNGYAVPGKWEFSVRDIKDTNYTNVRKVHVSKQLWGNREYKQGDTLKVDIDNYHEIFDGSDENENFDDD